MIGGVDEYIAFLSLRSLELLGEVQEAFGYAVLCKTLDPKVTALREQINLCMYHVTVRRISVLKKTLIHGIITLCKIIVL